MRAFNFYREACWPQPVTEPGMLALFIRKMRETFDQAWQLVRPPFERANLVGRKNAGWIF